MKRDINRNLPEFCCRIITERQKRGWSQEQLAEKIGMTRSCLNMKENGRRSFRLEEVSRIADVFDITLEELARGVKPSHMVTYRDLGLPDGCYEMLKAFHAEHPEGSKGLSKALSSPAVLDLLAQYMDFPMAEEDSGENRFVGITGISEDDGQIRCVMNPGFYGGFLQAALLQALREAKEK